MVADQLIKLKTKLKVMMGLSKILLVELVPTSSHHWLIWKKLAELSQIHWQPGTYLLLLLTQGYAGASVEPQLQDQMQARKLTLI